jgi:hypothetical protein
VPEYGTATQREPLYAILEIPMIELEGKPLTFARKVVSVIVADAAAAKLLITTVPFAPENAKPVDVSDTAKTVMFVPAAAPSIVPRNFPAPVFVYE